jgi:hypothetical protein
MSESVTPWVHAIESCKMAFAWVPADFGLSAYFASGPVVHLMFDDGKLSGVDVTIPAYAQREVSRPDELVSIVRGLA